MTPAERQARALAEALYPGVWVDVRPMEDGYVVRVMKPGPWPVRAGTPTEAEAWAHAAADLRADAERELAAMAARVDRIGQALEVE